MALFLCRKDDIPVIFVHKTVEQIILYLKSVQFIAVFIELFCTIIQANPMPAIPHHDNTGCLLMKTSTAISSLVLILLLFAGSGYLYQQVLREEAMQRSSSELVLTLSQRLTTAENPQIILDRAHESWPESGRADFLAAYQRFQPELGSLTAVRDITGEITLTHLLRLRSQSTVTYTLLADFEKGQGGITARLIWDNGRWQFQEYFLYRFYTAS